MVRPILAWNMLGPCKKMLSQGDENPRCRLISSQGSRTLMHDEYIRAIIFVTLQSTLWWGLHHWLVFNDRLKFSKGFYSYKYSKFRLFWGQVIIFINKEARATCSFWAAVTKLIQDDEITRFDGIGQCAGTCTL